MAYKPDVDDVRESPALDVIHLLRDKGAQVSYHDPYINTLSHEGVEMDSVDLDGALTTADCVVVATNHSVYEWEKIANQAGLIMDSRRALKGIDGRARVVSL